jgi:hypothetical protein
MGQGLPIWNNDDRLNLEGGPRDYERRRLTYPTVLNATHMAVNPRLNIPGVNNHPDERRYVINASPGLKYYKKYTSPAAVPVAQRADRVGWRVSENPMPSNTVVYCAELGKARFDTKLVRNLTWLAQLQRVMRVVMTQHLTNISTPVIRGQDIADEHNTEFNANEQFSKNDYDGTNYEVL